MKTEYSDAMFRVSNYMGYFHFGGSREKEYELEVRSQYRSEHDPEKPRDGNPGMDISCSVR